MTVDIANIGGRTVGFVRLMNGEEVPDRWIVVVDLYGHPAFLRGPVPTWGPRKVIPITSVAEMTLFGPDGLPEGAEEMK